VRDGARERESDASVGLWKSVGFNRQISVGGASFLACMATNGNEDRERSINNETRLRMKPSELDLEA